MSQIFLSFALTPDGTIVSARQRAVGEIAMTWRVIVLALLVLGIGGLVTQVWLTGLMFLAAFAGTRAAVEAIERHAARDLQTRIVAATGHDPST